MTQGAGGDKRGMQSAALLILKPLAGAAGYSDRVRHRPTLSAACQLDNASAQLPLNGGLRGASRRSGVPAAARRVSRPPVGRGRQARHRWSSSDTNKEAALAAAFRTRDLFPEGDGAWVAIADVQLRMGNRAEALDALRRAVELNPANKRQLPLNEVFAALHDAPEFQRLVQ